MLGLLLLTSYFGWVLLAVHDRLFAAAEPGRGRGCSRSIPMPALVVALLLAAPHLLWLSRERRRPARCRLRRLGLIDAVTRCWAQAGWPALAFEHAGLLVLVVVAGALLVDRRLAVPAIERAAARSVRPAVRLCVRDRARLVATLIAALRGQPAPLGGYGALVVLSGLAVIVAAGDMIRLYRQHAVSWTWLALLTGPPLVTVVASVLLPWTVAAELTVNEPAAEMGRFFSETFSRRTGRPLAIVIGDAHARRPRRPRLAAAAEPLCRRLAGARAVGDRRRRAGEGRDRGVAGHRCGRARRPRTSARACPTWWRRFRARSNVRAGCRCCASAGG